MSDCWYMRDNVVDRCAENRREPNEACSYETLAQLGVHYRRYSTDELARDVAALGESLVRELDYHAYDVIDIRPDLLGDERFDALAAQHFQEHLHEDDEVRLVLDGRGYFDIRDATDRWVRVLTQAGDCIVVPAGLYHRFTTTPERCTRAMRVFAHNPRWVAVPRPDGDALPVREAYLRRLRAPAQTVLGAAEGACNDVYSIADPATLDAQLTRIVAAHVRPRSDDKSSNSNADGKDGATSAATALLPSGDDSNKTAGLVVVLYVVGAAVPPRGESWCPDCVEAKAAVVQGVSHLRTQLPHARVLFVECPVQRANYRGNAEHVYRTHPLLRIRGVPTVLVLTPTPSSTSPLHAHADDKHDAVSWTSLLQVVLRTEEPQVREFAQLASTLQAQHAH